VARLAAVTRRDREATRDAIVVVTGLPRSGTSLMMAILEAAGVALLEDDARPADASNPRGYHELAAVRATARDAGWVEDAGGRAVKVVHSLVAALPRDRRYAVIVMRRPLSQVLASQDRMLERRGAPPTELPAERIAAVLSAQLDEAIALLEREPCFRWTTVDYPRLVADPVGETSRVLDFLGVEAPAAEVARVVEPALHRERG
jgi:hypothetical protein